MKKALVITLILGLIAPVISNAQEDLKRPDNSGIEEYDQFKNQAFDIYEASVDFKMKANGEAGLSADDIKKANELRVDLATLNDKANDMVASAKKLKSLKAPKAVGNTNNAIKALKAAIANFDEISDKLTGSDE